MWILSLLVSPTYIFVWASARSHFLPTTWFISFLWLSMDMSKFFSFQAKMIESVKEEAILQYIKLIKKHAQFIFPRMRRDGSLVVIWWAKAQPYPEPKECHLANFIIRKELVGYRPSTDIIILYAARIFFLRVVLAASIETASSGNQQNFN